jgi:uncharacterized membrane protein (UPF0127 family)
MRPARSAVLLLAAACSSTATGTAGSCPGPPSTVRFSPSAQLTVDVAATDAAREHGLMGVTDLPPDQGMAFVWTTPTASTFWMKDTLIPLSIAFVDADDRIVTIREMTPCERDPCPTYAADAPYTTAVEANAGWFDEHGVQVGDPMRLHEFACA